MAVVNLLWGWEELVYIYDDLQRIHPSVYDSIAKNLGRLIAKASRAKNPYARDIYKTKLLQLLLWWEKGIYIHPTRRTPTYTDHLGVTKRNNITLSEYREMLTLEYEK